MIFKYRYAGRSKSNVLYVPPSKLSWTAAADNRNGNGYSLVLKIFLGFLIGYFSVSKVASKIPLGSSRRERPASSSESGVA
jgi:hypothetical protein